MSENLSQKQSEIILPKWNIGDKAVLDIDGRIAGSLIVWGIAPEPSCEKDKYFGVVAVGDIYDEFDNLLFQPGESFNASYNEIKKPEEYSPKHINTHHCWCDPELDYEDPEILNQVWVHRELM